MRLRDLGGLIVVDFIDMEESKNRRDVEQRLRDALRNDRARVQFASISKFGLLEMSRQRLRPALSEGNHITCPRCNGTGHIRDTESSALQILRMVQEEAMKENTAAVHVQVPVEVTSFLLNEKRTEITKIELKQRVTVLLVPNKHLETPNYKLERLRHDDPRLENLQASYTMIEEPQDEVGITRRGDVEKKNKQEPVIKGILPEQPAPIAPPKPAPAPAPVAAPAPVVAAPAPAAKGGLFTRLFGWLVGSPAPAPAPAVEAAPAPAPTGDKPKREGGRDGRRGDRKDRGERSERGGERNESRGQGGRRDGKPAEARGERGERGERPERGERRNGGEGRAEAKPEQQRQERQERPERAERAERPERGERRPRGERAERANVETTDSAALAAPLTEAQVAVHDAPPAFVDSQAEGALPPNGDTPAAEERGGRRRRRRGGRDRDTAGTETAETSGELEAGSDTPVVAAEATADVTTEARGEDAETPTADGDDAEGQGRERRRRRRGGRGRREDNGAEGQETGTETADSADATAATAAEAPAAAPASLIEGAMAAAAPVAAPAAPVAEPVAAAPAPAPVAPSAPAFVLPVADLQGIAAGAGLQWVNSDADKIAAAQAAIAAEPAPAPLGREPAPVVVVDEGPLVLVETRKDLGQVKLPFEA